MLPLLSKKKMINLCQKYHINLGHSTTYYPQGNGLAESSNKSLVKIIKRLLAENKKIRNTKLKFALCADRVNTKKSIRTSPFQLVYGSDVIFPARLGLPVMKYIQDEIEEPNNMQRRICQIIEVQQARKMMYQKAQAHQDKIKTIFDTRTKEDQFLVGDLVLRWDARKEDKGKHGKFDFYGLVLSKFLKY